MTTQYSKHVDFLGPSSVVIFFPSTVRPSIFMVQRTKCPITRRGQPGRRLHGPPYSGPGHTSRCRSWDHGTKKGLRRLSRAQSALQYRRNIRKIEGNIENKKDTHMLKLLKTYCKQHTKCEQNHDMKKLKNEKMFK